MDVRGWRRGGEGQTDTRHITGGKNERHFSRASPMTRGAGIKRGSRIRQPSKCVPKLRLPWDAYGPDGLGEAALCARFGSGLVCEASSSKRARSIRFRKDASTLSFHEARSRSRRLGALPGPPWYTWQGKWVGWELLCPRKPRVSGIHLGLGRPYILLCIIHILYYIIYIMGCPPRVGSP